MFVRTPESKFNLANFMRVHLFTALGALKTGMDILLKEEGVKLDKILGHGGLFKTKVWDRIFRRRNQHPCFCYGNSRRGRRLGHCSAGIFW